jgi:sigma-54-specific transcriptional regulator
MMRSAGGRAALWWRLRSIPTAMTSPATRPRILTLPESSAGALSIRAKALRFDDPASAGLLEHVERIARSEAPVLIIGETGTGKELIARHLHAQSGRQGPFLAVNCGAFSDTLIDAELFGHESGAFTGASHARAGWFESAQGGTLFLDEIGDLPLALQVKLLRVLQECQVVRLGSRKSVPLDVRLVTATHIDLRRAVQAQHFRADLYWRLSVATVHLPPLRERPGDILPLARHFIGLYGPRLQAQHAVLAPEAEAALLAYPWPGNIRELENVIHFALIVCRQGVVRAGDLKLVPGVGPSPGAVASPARATVVDARAATSRRATPATGRLPGRSEPPPGAGTTPAGLLAAALQALLHAPPPRLFHAVEEALVRAAYDHCADNQVQTARLLGITRNTLRTLLKRFGLIKHFGLMCPPKR